MPSHTDPEVFGWADLDHGDVTQRLDRLEADIRREISSPNGQFNESKLPRDPANPWSKPYFSALYQFEAVQRERAREWVERAAKAYCDAGQQECGSVSPDFASAALVYGIRPFVSDRVSAFLLLAFRLSPADVKLVAPAYSSCHGVTEARAKHGAIQRILSELGSYLPAALKFEAPAQFELGSDAR